MSNAKYQEAYRKQRAHIGQGRHPEFAKHQPVQRQQTGRRVPADAGAVGGFKAVEDRKVVTVADRANGRTVKRGGNVFFRGWCAGGQCGFYHGLF